MHRVGTVRYVANLSILFPDLDLLDRPAAAARAGFDAVESWWPFPTATPAAAEVDAFVDAVQAAGVQLVALNFFAGDMAAGDRGILSWPGREHEFGLNVRAAFDLGKRLGTTMFNCLYGNRIPSAEQDDLAIANLRAAAQVARVFDATILLEPVSGVPAYPLRTADDVVAVIDRAGASNVALLADLYHLSVNGDDVAKAIDVHFGRIGHVQIADAPGRHEPGTGQLDLSGWLHTLDQRGYQGYVAAEYVPTGIGFDWMAQL